MRRLATACIAALALIVTSAQVPAPPPPPPVPATPEPPPAPPEPPVPTPPVPPLPPAPPVAPASEIEALLSSLPGVVVHYDALRETAGSIVLEGVRIAAKQPDGTPKPGTEATIARIEANDLDVEALRALIEAKTPGDSFRRIASRFAITGYAAHPEDGPASSIDSLTIENLEMKVFELTGLTGQPLPATPPSLETVAKALGKALDSVRFGTFVATGVRAEIFALITDRMPIPRAPAAPAQVLPGMSYEYGEIRIDGFDRGKIGRLSGKGIASSTGLPTGGELTSKVGEWSIDGIDVSALVPFLLKAEWPPITPEPLIALGKNCFRDYEIAVDGFGTFLFPETCTDAIPFVWLIPRHLHGALKGTFTPAEGLDLPAYLKSLFSETQDIEFEIEASYDPDSGNAAVTHYRFRMGAFGSVDFRFTFGGLQLASLTSLPSDYMRQLTLVSAEVEIVDEGGIDKILDMAIGARAEGAAGQPSSPEELKAQAKIGVDMMVGALGATPEAAAIGKAIKDFIDQGGTLVLQATPPKPLTIGDFATLAGKKPAEIRDLFGIGAAHTPP